MLSGTPPLIHPAILDLRRRRRTNRRTAVAAAACRCWRPSARDSPWFPVGGKRGAFQAEKKKDRSMKNMENWWKLGEYNISQLKSLKSNMGCWKIHQFQMIFPAINLYFYGIFQLGILDFRRRYSIQIHETSIYPINIPLNHYEFPLKSQVYLCISKMLQLFGWFGIPPWLWKPPYPPQFPTGLMLATQ